MVEKDVLEYYKLLIQARNFHYDNFNKWMTYYYVAIGALFVGYTQSLIATNPHFSVQLIIAFLGLIVSFFWHLSCKGYYFWIENWTRLLIKFEDRNIIEDNDKIYSVFSKELFEKSKEISIIYPWKSANISTSKVTLLFSAIVTFSWLLLLGFTICTKFLKMGLMNIFSIYCCLFFIILVAIICIVFYLLLIKTTSSLKNHIKI